MSDSRKQFRNQQARFFAQVQNPLPLLALIDHLPATYFFTKDRNGLFIHINRTLLDVLGVEGEIGAAGKTDYDFFPLEVADQFRAQDRQIMESGQPLVDHVCGVPDAAGVLRWYVETKIPLFDQKKCPIGVAGVMHDLEKAGATLAPYQRLSEALSHISNHYSQRITVEELAKLVHLSTSQFNRTFKQLFKTTPAQYINRVRVNAACSKLRATCDSVESIAERTGFCDASHFVRQFKKVMKLTPNGYRKQCSNSPLNR